MSWMEMLLILTVQTIFKIIFYIYLSPVLGGQEYAMCRSQNLQVGVNLMAKLKNLGLIKKWFLWLIFKPSHFADFSCAVI